MSLGISVVITMFNNCEQVNSALASINISYEYLSPEEKKSFEVIIVDDSPFYSAQIDQHFSFPIIIEKLKENPMDKRTLNRSFNGRISAYDFNSAVDSLLKATLIKAASVKNLRGKPSIILEVVE